jgi:hypothetical protein
MITNDRQSPPGAKEVKSLFESQLQVLQFTVDRDAKRHEGPCSRVNSGTLAGYGLFYQLCKLCGGSDRAVLDNMPRYSPAVTLFTVSLYELGQLLLRETVDDV